MAGNEPMQVSAPWAQPAGDVLATLGVDPAVGLQAAEVGRRQQRFGPNRLREHVPRSVMSILAAQFRSLIVALLVVAAAIGFSFGETLAGWAVVVVIVLNTAIGFFTELRAVRSMEALYALSNVTTRIRRNSAVSEIPAEQLVPGDLVVFEGGDIVTADLRIVEASRLQANESTLTGESLPVGKQIEPVGQEAPLAERHSMLYKGTAVTRGAGAGVVVATGMQTELGEISALVATAREQTTPLQQRLDQLGHRLIWVTLALTALVTLSGTLAGKELYLMIQTGLALAVAAIPEGLPVVATIALARGMQRMARRNALINRLSSVETLGATGVICVDKTGTLTENRMTVVSLQLATGGIEVGPSAGGYFQSDGRPVDPGDDPLLRAALETAVLCNDAELGLIIADGHPAAAGDPLEVALLAMGAAGGVERSELLNRLPEVREEAFDVEVKMMATFHRDGGGYREAVKGAPEAVLAASTRQLTPAGDQPLDAGAVEAWERRNSRLAATGRRVIALATLDTAEPDGAAYRDLTFIGLVGLEDPPRPDIRDAIAQCRGAGIEVVMITGDQAATALSIARSVGLVDVTAEDVILGSEMQPPHLLGPDERERQLQARLFARVSPKQKLDLIELHQGAGHIVAMTGDGVNDAPALEKADIGVAMGQRGTQVAREAADMVLQDDAFSSIVAAVREGRGIFANIRAFVMYLMSCNVSEVMVVALAALLGTALPILPLQILFLNLVTDVFPALALGVNPGQPELMRQPPRHPREPILGRGRWVRIALYGAAFTVSVLGALLIAQHKLGLDPEGAVTVSFLTLAFAQLWHVFNMRADTSGPWLNEVTRNRWVWAALALCTGLILAALYVPLLAAVLELQPPGLAGWLLVITMSLLPLLFGQLFVKTRLAGSLVDVSWHPQGR
jgi:Ca2+-transporting ATPase